MEFARSPNLIRLYDSTAWYWDSCFHRCVYRKAYSRLFRALVAEQRIGEAGRPLRVLDCGTGAGLLTEALKRTMTMSLDLFGIDASPGMLSRARRHLARAGIRATLKQGDICALPFRDEEMDLVMGALVIEHIAEPVVAIREMARVARSGAIVLVIATRPHAPDLPFRVAFHYKPFPEDLFIRWMANSGIDAVRVRKLSGVAGLFARAYVGRKAQAH